MQENDLVRQDKYFNWFNETIYSRTKDVFINDPITGEFEKAKDNEANKKKPFFKFFMPFFEKY